LGFLHAIIKNQTPWFAPKDKDVAVTTP